jgi:hypothetical protein
LPLLWWSLHDCLRTIRLALWDEARQTLVSFRENAAAERAALRMSA